MEHSFPTTNLIPSRLVRALRVWRTFSNHQAKSNSNCWTDFATHRLQREQSDELSFIFTDLTSGVTTYPACRFLTVVGPRENGRVDLDFNRATNPACAYTDFATCPLPPPGNHLSVRVEAGEKMPLSRIRSSELTLRCRERASI